MAKPVSYTKTPEDDEVVLEMVEPSFNARGGGETIGMYFERDGSKKKIDYVLVYERCQEKEDEDDESREKAENLEGMRKSFEASIENAGLIIDRVERPSSTVSSSLYNFFFKFAALSQFLELSLNNDNLRTFACLNFFIADVSPPSSR